jgi:hypothetical protein
MLELVGGGLLGSIFGGLFRLAPEVLKFLDKGNERKHELAMFTLQTDLEKVKGNFRMEEKYVDYSTEQLKAIQEAFKEQSTTAKEAGKFVSAVSALVRPGITWALFFMYATVKAAGLGIALSSGAPWQDVVLKGWSADDFAMLNMCLTFWFVGRSIEKYQK